MVDFFLEITQNTVLWAAISSWAVAQLIKIMIDFRKTKKINLSLITSTGGMPSSHSAFVVSMSCAVGMIEGFGTSIFALSAVLSLIVMSDAAGVRRAAGKQAKVINTIVASFENSGVVFDKKLKELLGHSPVEVAAGAVLGGVMAAIFVR